jgi:parvulin-like peptidyl-prolyl isomerase
MTDELNLTLPKRGTDRTGPPKLIPIVLFLLIGIGVANLVVALYGPHHRKEAPRLGRLQAQELQDLALKLEKQSLWDQATEAWHEYLVRSDLDAEGRAKIWYRIGKVHQDAGEHRKALAAYYRSESHAELPELAPDINRRVQECLELSGKFAALRYELEDRVGVEKTASGEEVVAEIGAYKITKAELDQRVEEQVERQLAMMAPLLTEEDRNTRKGMLMKHLSSEPARGQALNQILLEEILYRKAREDRLTEDPAVRARIMSAERSILAGQVLEREYAEEIKILPVDLETYYQAHKQDFMEPEQALISHILLENREAAQEALASLGEGADFAELAGRLSLDPKTKDEGGDIEAWVHKGATLPEIGIPAESLEAVFVTEADRVLDEPLESNQGFHLIKVRERRPERQKTFDEVRTEVYQALRSRKESEVSERLVTELKDRYDVVIHSSNLRKRPTDGSEDEERKN